MPVHSLAEDSPLEQAASETCPAVLGGSWEWLVCTRFLLEQPLQGPELCSMRGHQLADHKLLLSFVKERR